MAKLQHTFIKGKMNKDLDERLIPNGEYRDASNVQVSTSEGADVGAVENIIGNSLKNNKPGGGTWTTTGTNPTTTPFGLTNPKCIGTATDPQNEKIYWFLTSDGADAIVEFDQATGIVAPVLVDMGSVLNFSSDFLITGINVLSGLLMWTDNRNEPRVIKISLFKAGSSQGAGNTFSVTTQVYGRDFEDTDITVIKLKPNTQPVISMASSLRSGQGSGLAVMFLTKNFTVLVNGVYRPIEVGAELTLTGFNTGVGGVQPPPNWIVGDIVVLTAQRVNTQNFNSTYEIRIKIIAGGSAFSPKVTIESISLDLPFGPYVWTCVLEEDNPMFEFSFPRFAYRWKYVDNEYSAFSPWTEPAFLPGKFDYDSANVFNQGMINNLRKLTLSTFETAPKGVVEIDILYKDSASNVVYKVDSIAATATTFAIESELIYNVISSEQSIRPYDNVPKKAKSQEIVGNRIVYGNYTQNYDVPNPSQITITANSAANPTINSPLSSLRSLRTYQVGIVYLDKYGRETPVFTNDTATIILPKSVSTKRNRLSITSGQSAPADMTHFKYYIKDISNGYYNFVLDRFYDAGDGNVWLSIPSAERNKVAIDDFIILKKEHNNNNPVADPARYKIIDISNEVPVTVANAKTQLAFSQVGNSASPPVVGSFQVTFTGPSITDNPDFSGAFKGGNFVRFQQNSAVQAYSNYYEIETGGLEASTTTSYTLNFTTPLGQDIGSAIGNTYNLYVYDDEQVARPEYQGKFFAKINRDTAFDNAVLYTFTTDPAYYNIKSTISIIPTSLNNPAIGNPTASNVGAVGWAWNEFSGNTNAIVNTVPQMVTATSGETTFGFAYMRYYAGFPGSGLTNPTVLDGWDSITPDNFIQLQDSNGDYSEAMEITAINKGILFRSPTRTAIPVGLPGAGTEQSLYYVNVTVKNPLGPQFGDGTNSIPIGAKLLTRKRGVPIVFDSETVILPSPNPAIFETEPKENIDLDLYYEASNAFPIGTLGAAKLLNYFNCYSFGNGVESDRIEDDFNAPVIGKGVKVSTTLEDVYEEERRGAGLIYSGIFNNTSGVNELNQFIAGLKITKDLNPIYGTIQKLHARDTDLTVLMEDKIFKVLANKDALFNADGNSNLTSTDNVLGQTVPYGGAFGISKNPESFATFGFRAYFVDKARGAVLRLSRDGLTKISSNGMSDYFIDNLKLNTTGNVIGSYDSDSGSYNVCINVPDVRTNPGENPPAFSNSTESVAFKEKVNGWTTTMSYIPEAGISLNNEYYTFKSGEIWEHSNETRSNFYTTQFSSTVTPIINDAPTSVKKFKTLAYEGTAGWRSEIVTDQQNGEVPVFVKKEGSFYNYIQGIDTTVANLDTQEFSTQGLGAVLENVPIGQETLFINGAINVSLQANPQNPGGGAAGTAALDTVYTMSPGNTLRILGTVIAINRTDNSVTLSAPITGSPLEAGDFVFFGKDTRINTSGIIGYYAETKMITTDSTKEELFSISSEVFISSE